MQEKKLEQIRRIKQISVSNLFGMFDHTIPLNLDERITIIHGPNGFGKTVILKLLNELFSLNKSAIQATPFREFQVVFEDGAKLRIDKVVKSVDEKENTDHSPSKETNSSQEVSFHFVSADERWTCLLPSDSILRSLSSLPEEVAIRSESETERVGTAHTDAFEITPAGEIEIHELLVKFSTFASALSASLHKAIEVQRYTNNKEFERLRSIRRTVSIRFIETQRLLNQVEPVKGSGKDQPKMVPTVTAYSQELTEIIKTKLAESTALSQSLDRTFPERVVNPTVPQRNVNLPGLRISLGELEAKRSYLMAVGLIDQDNNDAIHVQVSDQIDESTKAVLSVYVEDAEKKLGVFDEVADKIDLLKRIINKRFLYKAMTISRNDGFVFTNANGVILSPTDLSSGEQHELVLFYELLFKVAPGSLVLIDEPEISLHVVWQEQFLRDVQEVTRLNNIDVLIATHSPDVIDGLGDLMVELKEPGGGELSRVRE